MIKKIIAIACFTAASAFAQQTIYGPCTGSYNIQYAGPLTVTGDTSAPTQPYVQEVSPSSYVYLNGYEMNGPWYFSSVPAGIYTLSMSTMVMNCYFDW